MFWKYFKILINSMGMIMNLLLFSSSCQKYYVYLYIRVTRWNYDKSAFTSNKGFSTRLTPSKWRINAEKLKCEKIFKWQLNIANWIWFQEGWCGCWPSRMSNSRIPGFMPVRSTATPWYEPTTSCQVSSYPIQTLAVLKLQ